MSKDMRIFDRNRGKASGINMESFLPLVFPRGFVFKSFETLSK